MVYIGDKDPRKLSFALPKGVTCHEKGSGFQLVRNFPLKTMILHPAWGSVFKRLSNGGFVPFETIVSVLKERDLLKVELFLNDLVRKGFLEQEGISVLSEHPVVSIIVPVQNRASEIEECLISLNKLIYPIEKLETIVVDDASTDHTPQVVSGFPVHLIRLKENRQAPYCRNLAAQNAKGDLLAFIDSDCMADARWLQELVPTFNDRTTGAVGGMVGAYYQESALDRYEEVKSSLIIGRRMRRSMDRDKAFYVPSCNLLVKRDLFLKLGGFREELLVGEDVDFCWRMQDAGHHVEFRSVGRVSHKHRNRLAPFCVRRFDYGTSEPLLQRLHPKRGKEMVFPLAGVLFWGVAVFGIFMGSIALFSLIVVIVFMDTLRKWAVIRPRGLSIGFSALFLSVLRGYFTFFYHCSAFVSRYYLMWAALMLPLLPAASALILGMHLFNGLMEYVMKKPRLNPLSFLFYFSLEQLSYQMGVWWGCIKNLSFKAVNPRVIRNISDVQTLRP
ncbi:mycofactocin biosynthesis glycosyltransferase MftF [Thermodesulfobacteriota bacterium]